MVVILEIHRTYIRGTSSVSLLRSQQKIDSCRDRIVCCVRCVASILLHKFLRHIPSKVIYNISSSSRCPGVSPFVGLFHDLQDTSCPSRWSPGKQVRSSSDFFVTRAVPKPSFLSWLLAAVPFALVGAVCRLWNVGVNASSWG